MAIATKEFASKRGRRFTDASAADTLLALSTPAVPVSRLPFKVSYVAVKYSAAPTQAGVTIELDSGAGVAYDTTLSTGSANAQNTVYFPTGDDLILANGDAIRVTAPAGGGVITSAISIYGRYVE